MATQQQDGGEVILQAFRNLGINYVFSSPGSEWSAVWEALARQQAAGLSGAKEGAVTVDEQRVVESVSTTVVSDGLGTLVDRNPDDAQPTRSIAAIERPENRSFTLAGGAPGGEEIEDHEAAPGVRTQEVTPRSTCGERLIERNGERRADERSLRAWVGDIARRRGGRHSY